MSDGPAYTCNDYREEMTLLALRNRLNSASLSEEERRKIKKEIKRFEERIGMK
jgi:hypothetical protein